MSVWCHGTFEIKPYVLGLYTSLYDGQDSFKYMNAGLALHLVVRVKHFTSVPRHE